MSAAVEILAPQTPGRRSIAAPRVLPVAALFVPMTDEARAVLGGPAFVRIASFPFNIGREGRAFNALTRVVVSVERRLSAAPQLNDLYLLEPPGPHFQISRKHCAIDRVGTGFLLLDRNSACGSGIVRSQAPAVSPGPFVDRIGIGTPIDRALLSDGDLIVLGNVDSPYVFRIDVEHASISEGPLTTEHAESTETPVARVHSG